MKKAASSPSTEGKRVLAEMEKLISENNRLTRLLGRATRNEQRLAENETKRKRALAVIDRTAKVSPKAKQKPKAKSSMGACRLPAHVVEVKHLRADNARLVSIVDEITRWAAGVRDAIENIQSRPFPDISRYLS